MTLAVVLVVALVGTGCRRSQSAAPAQGTTTTTAGAGGDAGALTTNNTDNDARPDETPVDGGQLVYGVPAEANSWNPATALWTGQSIQVARTVFDTMFEYDAGGTPQPFLLESATHNPAYTEWTLKLRPGLKFHNGKRVTAKAIIRNQVSYALSPAFGGVYFLNGKDLPAPTEVDDLTFKVRTTKPWVTLPQQAATQLGVVADPDWMERKDSELPIGTGPFRMEKWEPNKRTLLTKNHDYWRKDAKGRALPHLDKVEFQIIPDDLERTDALHRGRIDAMMQITPSANLVDLRKEADAGKLQYLTNEKEETAEDFILLNTTAPPLDDIDARRALAIGIDREQVVRQLMNGTRTVANSMFAPGSPWFSDTPFPKYDPEEAKRLVEKVKAQNGGTFAIKIKGPTSPDIDRFLFLLQQAWGKIGVTVDVEPMDQVTLIRDMARGNYQAALIQQFDYPHPSADMVFLNPRALTHMDPQESQTLSFSRINDSKLQTLIDSFMAATDLTGQRTAMAQIQARVNELLPFIYIDHAVRTIVVRNGVINMLHDTLPDGSDALPFVQGSQSLAQVWLRAS